MGKLKCPECGSDLQLTVDVVCEHSQKINNDGSLHKVKNISTRGNVNGAPYLQCTGHKCCFTYDVEHASHDKPVKEFDEWIAEHLEEIYQLNYDLEEKIHMYKYFISFTYSSYEKGGYGNVIIEADHKISDFNNTDDMQKWVIDLQRWIESNANIKNVIIMNFKLIN